MSHSTRASQVQRLLAQDSIKLGEYRALHRDAPLRFQLVQSAAELKQGELEACLKLVEHTSGDDYKASSVGWKVKNKLVEMGDVEMMYLLVRQADGDPRHAEVAKEDRKDTTEELKSSATSKNEGMVHQHHTAPRNNGTILGFMSFMFTYDDPPHEDREVAYLYEIHLLEQLRGRGLGKKLVEFLEMAARQTGISKTMLTVFASNSAARGLYENLGYGKDACSPGDRVIRRRVIKADYIIMSKELV